MTTYEQQLLHDSSPLIERFRRMIQTKVRVLTDDEVIDIFRQMPEQSKTSFIRTMMRVDGIGT